MVLSYLLQHSNIKHTLLHCNFNLRSQDSIDDEQFIIDYAIKNNIEYETISFNTKLESEKRKLNTQECARILRYDWFKTFLKTDNNSILLTAHHLDDSIETFFINTLRGTGLKGLSGIPNGKHKIYRPLLSFTKKEIKTFANTNSIQFREDISNQSDNYLRNKLRHHLIPEFKNLTENLETKMTTMFDELNQTQQFIEAYIENFKSKNNFTIENIQTVPEFMWHKLFSEFGVTRKNNGEIVKLINSQTGATFITVTHKLLKNRTEIIISDAKNTLKINQQIKADVESIEIYETRLTFEITSETKNINFCNTTAYLDFDKLNFPLQIRNWQQGDKIQPLGMKNGSKLISDVLINKKVNQFNKSKQLVITSNNTIVWLVDLMVSEQFALSKHTKKIFKINILK